MTARAARAATLPVPLLAVLLAGLAPGGCGRKGPPLPPLAQIPAPVGDLSVRRLGDEVYVRFTIPAQNVDGTVPASVSRVEVFALTAATPPSAGDIVQPAARIAAVAVAPPAGERDRDDPSPAGAGAAAQGGRVTVLDVLTAAPAAPGAEGEAESGPTRFYVATAVSPRGRRSAAGRIAAVPAGPVPAAPNAPSVTYDANLIRLEWASAGDAVSYNVYREPSAAAGPVAATSGAADAPAPINSMPIAMPVYTEPVLPFGEQRCYRVRAVRAGAGGGIDVESEPSPRVCATPEDTFPPAAPTGLEVVAGPDGIALLWEANREPDLGGYLVLRGAPGDVTLLPVTDRPVVETQYLDRAVMPGMRYEYAVVAVDSRQPPNRSPESERDAATAR